jgi:hypothetical protein
MTESSDAGWGARVPGFGWVMRRRLWYPGAGSLLCYATSAMVPGAPGRGCLLGRVCRCAVVGIPSAPTDANPYTRAIPAADARTEAEPFRARRGSGICGALIEVGENPGCAVTGFSQGTLMGASLWLYDRFSREGAFARKPVTRPRTPAPAPDNQPGAASAR